jgi:molybdenum cofactor cytidylyltransferase
MTTFALIPAAGKSTRMGRPKLALPLGDGTVLGQVISTLRRAPIDHILVVIGPHVRELVDITAKGNSNYLLLTEETRDMRATVEAGLRHIQAQYSPGPGDALLLVPGDHPTLQVGVIQLLFEAQAGNPDKSIFIPTHEGKRGHPALIDWKHVAGIRGLPAGKGLNAYLRAQSPETLEVSVESAEVLFDLDTPGDYHLLREGMN